MKVAYEGEPLRPPMHYRVRVSVHFTLLYITLTLLVAQKE